MWLNNIFLILGSFSNLPNLYELHMKYTTLTDLPTGFAFQCNALQKIYVYHGLLETSGDCKNWFRNLEILSMSWISDAFADLPCLIGISFYGSKLTTVKAIQFAGIKTTGIAISLGSSDLSTIEPQAFEGWFIHLSKLSFTFYISHVWKRSSKMVSQICKNVYLHKIIKHLYISYNFGTYIQ